MYAGVPRQIHLRRRQSNTWADRPFEAETHPHAHSLGSRRSLPYVTVPRVRQRALSVAIRLLRAPGSAGLSRRKVEGGRKAVCRLWLRYVGVGWWICTCMIGTVQLVFAFAFACSFHSPFCIVSFSNDPVHLSYTHTRARSPISNPNSPTQSTYPPRIRHPDVPSTSFPSPTPRAHVRAITIHPFYAGSN